jgi:hypothetical protein
MPVPKRVRDKQTQPRQAMLAVKPAAKPDTGHVTVNLFDGTRQPIKASTQVLLTVRDGAQNQLYRNYVRASSVDLELPFHNNFSDNYAIIAYADGYEQAGFQPVKIGPNVPQALDLMLLPKDGSLNFAGAKWGDLAAKRPLFAGILAASPGASPTAYSQVIEDHPDHLACLLNITTAMQQIFLPQGTPLDYFKQFDLTALAPDRMYGYADAKLVDQVKLAAQQGMFETQPAIDLSLHGDATASFKEIRYGEANVQLTFHEHKRKTVGGVDCVYVEPDIDYFKDPGAHFLMEVIPNTVTGNVSDPRVVYVLRWMASRRAGVPNFDPLYTVE